MFKSIITTRSSASKATTYHSMKGQLKNLECEEGKASQVKFIEMKNTASPIKFKSFK